MDGAGDDVKNSCLISIYTLKNSSTQRVTFCGIGIIMDLF
jgi:hypothetical protein